MVVIFFLESEIYFFVRDKKHSSSLSYIQLLSFKRIAGSSSERYRLLISDGMYSNSYAMLATQLNKMVTDSTLDEFCVIKVKRLQCNTMQGKKVIIILDMEVLRPGSQVRTF